MTDLIPSPTLDNVPQIETNTPVLGGFGGPANQQAQALLNRQTYFQDSLAAPDGAGLVGWERAEILSEVDNLHKAQDAEPFTQWEFANLVTNKPTPSDPSTWDWQPAWAAFFSAVAASPKKMGRAAPGVFPSFSSVSMQAGITVDFTGATIKFTAGALQTAADCTLIRPSIDGNSKTNGAAGINIPSGSHRVTLIQPKVRAVFSNAVDNSNGSDDLWIMEPDFDDIGGAAANPTFQACGVYTSGDRVRVLGGRISRTLGQGAIFVNGGDDITISNVHFHDTKFRAVNLFNNPTNVLVSENKIRRAGELLAGPSGVGANGIFCVVAAAADAVVIGNDIADVVENGIEGRGTFINNVIDTTGYRSLTTPSKEGIFLSYDAVCRGNTIRNAAEVGIKTFNQQANARNDISDNDIISPGLAGISVQADSATGSYAFLNVQGNTIDGANQPAQGGINIFATTGGTFGTDTGLVNNLVYGRATNTISSTINKRYGNNFDPRIVMLNDASGTPHQSPKTDRYTAIYDAAITSSKTVLVNTTNPSTGDRVRVVRTANATGAFNVNLSTGATLKALAAASTWAEAEYNGTAWVLVGGGAL